MVDRDPPVPLRNSHDDAVATPKYDPSTVPCPQHNERHVMSTVLVPSSLITLILPSRESHQPERRRTPLRRAICHTYNLRTQNLSTIYFSKMSTCPPDRCSRYTYRRRPYVDSGLQISSYVRKIPYTKHVRRTSGLQIFRHVRFLP
jgi:hypothetical protein